MADSSVHRTAQKHGRNCRKVDGRGSAGLDGTWAAQERSVLQGNRITLPLEVTMPRQRPSARITRPGWMLVERLAAQKGDGDAEYQAKGVRLLLSVPVGVD